MRKLILYYFTFFYLKVLGVEVEDKKPIYNIAHMVNTIEEINYYLERGANAIETDVTFNSNGTIATAYHGYPCDCFRFCDRREDFVEFIKYVKLITTPGTQYYRDNFVLLFFDMKTSSLGLQNKYTAGTNFAKQLIQHLWNGGNDFVPINVLISIGHTRDRDIIRGFRDTLTRNNLDPLLDKIGWDVGLNDGLPAIQAMWKRLNINQHIWQGDGINNCVSTFRPRGRLRRALSLKDSSQSNINKVYQWTIDYTIFFRRSLKEGVDAFITNFPERLNNVLEEKGIKEYYRLATIEDNCWDKKLFRFTNENQFQSLQISNSVITNVFSVFKEMFNSAMTFANEFSYNRNTSISRISSFAPSADNNKNEGDNSQVRNFCHHTLCTILERFNNDNYVDFESDNECRDASSNLGKEIAVICSSLSEYLKYY